MLKVIGAQYERLSFAEPLKPKVKSLFMIAAECLKLNPQYLFTNPKACKILQQRVLSLRQCQRCARWVDTDNDPNFVYVDPFDPDLPKRISDTAECQDCIEAKKREAEREYWFFEFGRLEAVRSSCFYLN